MEVVFGRETCSCTPLNEFHCPILSSSWGWYCPLSGNPPDHFYPNILSLLSLPSLRKAATADGIVMPVLYDSPEPYCATVLNFQFHTPYFIP